MKSKKWLIFAGWQIAGYLIGLSGSHVDWLSYSLSFLMLLPGSFLDLYLFRLGGPGNYWPKWTLFATAVVLNLCFFGIVTLFLGRRKVRTV